VFKSFALFLGYCIVRLLAATYRFRAAETGGPRHVAGTQGYVLATWHQNLFAGILAQSARPHCVIVSRSGDGDPVTYLCQRLGHQVVRGSSRRGTRDKGGKQAKDEMIEVLRSGVPGAVTVDGPSGPAHQVKPGIIEMARLAGVPVVPYLTLPRRYWSFPSWDAFRLPKPFTRIDVCYGAPIAVGAELTPAEFEGYLQSLAESLQALEREQAQRRNPPLASLAQNT